MQQGPPQARRRLGIVIGISIGIHLAGLAMVSRTVVFPSLYEPPALIAATLRSSDYLPIPRAAAEMEGAVEQSLSSIDLLRIRDLPPMTMPSRVVLPAPIAPDLTPSTVSALAGAHGPPEAFAQALQALSDPAAGRRGAFEGRMYFFSKLDAVRTDGEWLQGTGRIETEDRLYTYTCLFPGRGTAKRASQDGNVIAVDYRATVPWPNSLAGEYAFRLTSDDGAVFQIDGQDVIAYDGAHGFKPKEGSVRIAPGLHEFRLVYIQSHRSRLGLILHYRRIDQPRWEVLDLRTVLLAAANRADNPELAQAPDMDSAP